MVGSFTGPPAPDPPRNLEPGRAPRERAIHHLREGVGPSERLDGLRREGPERDPRGSACGVSRLAWRRGDDRHAAARRSPASPRDVPQRPPRVGPVAAPLAGAPGAASARSGTGRRDRRYPPSPRAGRVSRTPAVAPAAPAASGRCRAAGRPPRRASGPRVAAAADRGGCGASRGVPRASSTARGPACGRGAPAPAPCSSRRTIGQFRRQGVSVSPCAGGGQAAGRTTLRRVRQSGYRGGRRTRAIAHARE